MSDGPGRAARARACLQTSWASRCIAPGDSWRNGAVTGAAGTLGRMDDERWSPGMPVLQRQPVRDPRLQANLPPSLQGLPPRSVPETAPTPLQPYYINLSVIVFLCGLVAITALELGAG